jgi:peptidoglycan/xylan/chitin deacetylase (PgdA/CDA1 family)
MPSPDGITKGSLCQTAVKQGYTGVLWTISSADSNPIGADIIARNVIHTPNPGDIVLIHDGAGHTASAKALPQILKELSAAGFHFVTVPELLQAWQQWQAGQKVSAHARP